MPKNKKCTPELELKRLSRKLSDRLQEAYIKVALDKYNEELKHCITEEEISQFKIKWNKIIALLEDGWILDIDSLK